MAPPALSSLSRDEREKYLWQVFREAEQFRAHKEPAMIETFRYIRGIKDQQSPYKTDLRHPYAFTVAQAIKASIYPAFLAGDPAIQLLDPNPDNHPRNQITEKILTSFIKNPLKTNFPSAFEKTLDATIWFGWSRPYTYFRSRHQVIGPRYVPVEENGQVQLDSQNRPIVRETFRKVRTYHAPWLEEVDNWDSWTHPDGRRVFTRRDVTGYELLGQTSSANPLYGIESVSRLINAEFSSLRTRKAESAHTGPDSFSDRDVLASEAGAEPPRHSEMEMSIWDKDVLAKPFILMHYDDGEFSGTYAVVGQRGGFKELRFNQGASYDGTHNTLLSKMWQSPQELMGTSWFEVSKDLLRLHSRMYQAAGDSMALQVLPMFAASNQLRMLGNELVFSPGGIIWTPPTNRTTREHFERVETGADFVNTFNIVGGPLKNDLDRAFFQDDVRQGFLGGGRRTAQEVREAAAGGQAITNVFIKKLGDEFVTPLARKWTAMMSEHYTARDFVKMLGPIGADYIPPSVEELIDGLQYTPRASLTIADSQLRRQQWPGIMQVAIQMLPLLQVPHMRELFKRMMEDMEQDDITRIIPSQEDPRFTEYQAMIQQSQAQQAQAPQGQGTPSPPRSPTDISGMLRQIGGESAPAGPVNGGTRGISDRGF